MGLELRQNGKAMARIHQISASFFHALFLISTLITLGFGSAQASSPYSAHYQAVQKGLQTGWNTFNTHSVTAHVLMPEALEVRLNFARTESGVEAPYLTSPIIGPKGALKEKVEAGPHALDGRYTEVKISWGPYVFRVQSAHANKDVVILVTPLNRPQTAAQHTADAPLSVIVTSSFLWGRSGHVLRDAVADSVDNSGQMVAHFNDKRLPIFVDGNRSTDPNYPVSGPFLAAYLDQPMAVSVGEQRSLAEVNAIIARERDAYLRVSGLATSPTEAAPTDEAIVREAIKRTIAWNMIYEPEKARVVVPVSRGWNISRGGYVLFPWDSFLAAKLINDQSKALAYANMLEILAGATDTGMVPQYVKARKRITYDRSNPPLASAIALEIYERHKEKWFLQDSFNRLLAWNRWWAKARVIDDYMTWGSIKGLNPKDNPIKVYGTGNKIGAMYESGLDNSPMYDDIAFDQNSGLLRVADVGLISLYIADCQALSKIARLLGRTGEAKELDQRAKKHARALSTLWDKETGIYRNKNMDTGVLSTRLSPTSFYPLLTGLATPKQADEMISRHLLNEKSFWGQQPLPSISRDDADFKDQDYWRGRIWPPMNYLVYQGLKNYDTPLSLKARRELAKRSLAMWLHEWNKKGYSMENYSPLGFDADTVHNADTFYIWGALMGWIGIDAQQDTQKEKIH